MLPTFMYIQEENNIIRATKIQHWLTRSQIQEVLQSCNDTLKYYDQNNYTDELINKLNDDWFEEEYNLYKNYSYEKAKTFVYIMIDHNTKYYKIGKSDNPLKREKTLQSEKPTIELVYKFECEYGQEKELHNKYNSKRIRGEWFNLDVNDIEYIKTNYK